MLDKKIITTRYTYCFYYEFNIIQISQTWCIIKYYNINLQEYNITKEITLDEMYIIYTHSNYLHRQYINNIYLTNSYK